VLEPTDISLPNQDESSSLTKEDDLASDASGLGGALWGTVVVKLGAAGSYHLRAGKVVYVDGLPAQVDNPVGAGDVCDAGVADGYSKSGDVLEAMILGAARHRCMSLVDSVAPLIRDSSELDKSRGALALVPTFDIDKVSLPEQPGRRRCLIAATPEAAWLLWISMTGPQRDHSQCPPPHLRPKRRQKVFDISNEPRGRHFGP
jgi:hypothetical protein